MLARPGATNPVRAPHGETAHAASCPVPRAPAPRAPSLRVVIPLVGRVGAPYSCGGAPCSVWGRRARHSVRPVPRASCGGRLRRTRRRRPVAPLGRSVPHGPVPARPRVALCAPCPTPPRAPCPTPLRNSVQRSVPRAPCSVPRAPSLHTLIPPPRLHATPATTPHHSTHTTPPRLHPTPSHPHTDPPSPSPAPGQPSPEWLVRCVTAVCVRVSGGSGDCAQRTPLSESWKLSRE
ncbi:hypothetical protein FHS42_007140 [Streptomyces zagrosensis]|uniref:Uncharacterized protein n=1 Tax=Streptomyces zagrosensis TaxID=1042984 RepID=A0A7W9QJA6_9ACTN|nr:hypothetical protein [Streptomyces zagrosensis]